jgi:hypothetical protein
MGPFTQFETPDLSGEACTAQIVAETYGRYGSNCDQIECGARSSFVCESENCSNCPCELHAGHCPDCQKPYCASRDKMLHTCWAEHRLSGKCPGQSLRVPLEKLAAALDSEKYSELTRFVRHNSDGLGNPLPHDVCDNLGLAVDYLNNSIPEYDKSALLVSRRRRRISRNEKQRIRRAMERRGLGTGLGAVAIPLHPPEPFRLEPYKRSTIHLVAAAVAVRHWTGQYHYRRQMELLRIMGLFKGEDFIRDRVDYLRRSNPQILERIELSVRPEVSRFSSPDLSH